MFFENFHHGEDLTKDDEILQKARKIMTTKKVSKNAFNKNLQDNPHDNEAVNKRRLEKMGIQITDIDYSFNLQELASYRQRMSQGYWQQFCNQLVFAELRTKDAKELFMDLPNNPEYSDCFK